MQTYLARLCWNSVGWQYPNGDARGQETGKSYVNEKGFGHEEWLFDYSHQLDGYHYGFVEPFNGSRQVTAQEPVALLLYAVAPKAISPNRQRYFVGEIRRCEMLSDEERASAVERYERAGWLDSMREQVEAIDGDVKCIRRGHSDYNSGIFNLRFRPEDAERYDPMRPAADEDRVRKLNHYVLCRAETTDQQAFRRLPQGRQEPLPVQRVQRAGTAPTFYDPAHPALQNHLRNLLRMRYGDHVTVEDGYVDVKVTHPDFHAYFEIKTSTSAVQAIRDGLGQLLQYAFEAQGRGLQPAHCIISSPCPETDESRQFLSFVSQGTGLPLQYWQINLATDTLPNS